MQGINFEDFAQVDTHTKAVNQTINRGNLLKM